MKITDISGSFTLNNGIKMPYLGLGTFEATKGPEVKNAIHYALDAGYRLIDTASFYKNEQSVGEAIRENGLNREDVFVTTKLWTDEMEYEQALQGYDKSLDRLGLEYVDLYLIHWPVTGKFLNAWKALEKIYEEGRVKAIGISNFLPVHLKQLLPQVNVMPTVNQMEFHPYLIQQELIDLCTQNNIIYQAWGPLIQGRIFDIPLLKQIGKKYKKNQAQVVLRWSLQRGVATIPKSVNQSRIESNAELFDFVLNETEMDAIDALDCNRRFGYDPMLV